MRIQLLLFLFLFLGTGMLMAQETGEVCIRTISTALVKIDGKLTESERVTGDLCLTLKAGIHIVEIWAPRYEVITDTITIIKDESFVYSKPLKTFNAHFLAYKENLQVYESKRNKRIRFYALVGAGAASTAVLALITNGSLNKKWDQLESLKATYNNSTDALEIKRAATDYRELQKNYNSNRIGFHYIPLALSASFTIYGGWRISKDRKKSNPKPIFVPGTPWTSN